MEVYTLTLILSCVILLLSVIFLFFKYTKISQTLNQAISDKVKFETSYLQYLELYQKVDKELSLNRDKRIEVEKNLISSQQENNSLIEKLTSQKDELLDLQNRFKFEFEKLAQKILDDKSEKFTKQNEERLSHLLNPLKSKIIEFQKKVENNNKDFIEKNTALMTHLTQLKEMNSIISKEAQNLTKALTMDNKIQGDWGEFLLESILEKSGLRNGHEYFTQSSYTDKEGKRLRPDVIVQLPEEKHLIIDSKVSLVAYNNYVNEEEDKQYKNAQLQAHIQSIKQHIESLSKKNYPNIQQINSPDYVLLFIPIEPAFHVAVHQNQNLFIEAFDKNIVLVSPTTLLATLKTISSIWKQENQNNNSREIAKKAGDMLDKFTSFVKDLEAIGNRIKQAEQAYQQATNKLNSGRGNLVTRALHLKQLGVKTSKELPKSLLHQTSNIESDEEPHLEQDKQ